MLYNFFLPYLFIFKISWSIFPWQAFPDKVVYFLVREVGAPDTCSSQLSLLRNIRLGRKVMAGTNTLAYSAVVTKKKSFISFSPAKTDSRH